MKIAITGAAGFIGSSLSHWIINQFHQQHKIVGIDNMSGGYESNFPLEFNFINEKVDLANAEELRRVFDEYGGFDLCFHFGAYAAEGRANHIRRFIHANNTIGTLNVINECVRNQTKLVFTSSVAVYSGEFPFHESITPHPIDEYGISKYSSEMSIRVAGYEQDLRWCIVRPRNVFGPRQSLWDPARNLMGIWMYNALNGLPCQIFGDGQNRRCFTYIGDILEPLWNASKQDYQVINLGASKSYSISEAAEIFKEVTGYDNFIHTEARPEVKEAICDISKSEELLGYSDKTSLRDGLVKMWEWAQGQPWKDRIIPPPLEVSINAHSSLK